MRLIDADRLKRVLIAFFTGAHLELPHISKVIDFLDNAQTIDAEPVRHGHWIENHHVFYVFGENYKPALNVEIDYKCSICNKDNEKTTDYCPKCGAKMDDVSER